MISSSFTILTKDVLKLQEAVKYSNGRFKRFFTSGEKTYVAIDFDSSEKYKIFKETWMNFTKKIKEIDKRPNFFKKIYRRYLKFWK